MKTTTTTTIRTETVIELSEADITQLIREKYNLAPFTEVEYDTRNDHFYGASIVQVTTEVAKP